MNFMNNLFTLTGSLNNIAGMLFSNTQTIDWTDLNGCFTKYDGIASDIGKIFRAILQFDPSKMNNSTTTTTLRSSNPVEFLV